MAFAPPGVGLPAQPQPTVVQPPAAVLARKRHDARTDARRRAGTQALAQSPFADPVPQMQTPSVAPPTFTPPAYTPPLYEPPKKGLSYLAAGLSLLFPGAPIAQAASSFAQGLGQGAEQKFERASQAAQAQYQTQQTQAQAQYENAKTAYDAAQTKAQTDFQNAQLLWQSRKDLRARGVNPLTNAPFQYPTLTQIAGPRPSAQATLAGYARLIQLASRNGDENAVAQYDAQMKDFVTMADEQAKDAAAWQRVIVAQQGANQRAQFHEQAADARQAASESAAMTREIVRAQLTQDNPQKLLQQREEVLRLRSNFLSEYRAYTTAQGTNQPLIAPDVLPALSQALTVIGRSTDPEAMAQRFIDASKNQSATNLLQQYGALSAVDRQSRGLPILALPPMPQPKAPVRTSAAPNTAQLPIGAQIANARAHGASDDLIRSVLAKHGYATIDIERALHAQALPGLGQAPTARPLGNM